MPPLVHLPAVTGLCTNVIVVAVRARRIEGAVLVHVEGYVKYIRIGVKRLLYAIAVVHVPGITDESREHGRLRVGWLYQSKIRTFFTSSGYSLMTAFVAIDTLSKMQNPIGRLHSAW